MDQEPDANQDSIEQRNQEPAWEVAVAGLPRLFGQRKHAVPGASQVREQNHHEKDDPGHHLDSPQCDGHDP
jgi:hypothetical protein